MLRKHDVIFLISALLAASPVYAQEASPKESSPAEMAAENSETEAVDERVAQWRETGISYFEGGDRFIRQDYLKAREYFEKSGAKGDAVSLYYLGNIYNDGLGVTIDEDKARLLYYRAAQHGHPDSQLLVAVYLIMDSINEHNEKRRNAMQKEAVEWLEKAVAQGNTEAKFWLGDLTRKGLGTPKDEEKGRQLLQQAADEGNPNALAMVAAFYWKGIGGKEKDLLQAHALMSKASRAGNDQATVLLERIEAEMTPEEQEAARKAALTALKAEKSNQP